MLDGVYVPDPLSNRPTFIPVASPTDDQVQHLIEQVAHRLIAQLERGGVLDDRQSASLAEQAPLLAGIIAASIQGMVATGARAGPDSIRTYLTGVGLPAEPPAIAPATLDYAQTPTRTGSTAAA